MFDYDKTVRKLEEFNRLSDRKQQKYIKKLLLDEEFLDWLYDSGKNKNNAITVPMVDRLYSLLSKPKVLRQIIEVADDEGYDSFDRTQATFIYSICNFAIEANNERAKLLSEDLADKKISREEAKNLKGKLDKYSDIIADAIRACRKIVKYDAKKLSRNTNVPKDLCMHSYWHVPSPNYVATFKIGFYLNGLLNIIYDNASETGFADRRTIYWREFFREIFGKNSTPNVATFILLEGVNRIDKYKNKDGVDSVKKCWDSLTEFALKELNDSPEAVRNQMVELYIKRIDKMFKNNSYDLRVNILALPNQFKNLISTVSNYKDKIKAILNNGNSK